MAQDRSKITQEKASQSLANNVENTRNEKKTAEDLGHTAKSQLENLFEQKKILVEMSSGLNIKKEQYSVNNSYITIAADWYNDKSWWNKLGTSILFISAGALAGTVFELGALFATISLILNYAASFILSNHSNATHAQKKLIEEDIKKMEKRLEISVNAFNATANELQETLKTLCRLNIQLVGSEKKFKAQVKKLEVQNGIFESGINQLKKLTKSLIKRQISLANDINITKDDAQTISDKQTLQESEMKKIASQVSESAISLNLSAKAIITLNDRSLQSVAKLDGIENMMSQYLDIIENLKTASLQENNSVSPETAKSLKGSLSCVTESIGKNNSQMIQSNGLFSSKEKSTFKPVTIEPEKVPGPIN